MASKCVASMPLRDARDHCGRLVAKSPDPLVVLVGSNLWRATFEGCRFMERPVVRDVAPGSGDGRPDYRCGVCDRWDPEAEGVLVLPSGRCVRGRGLRPTSRAGPSPNFGLYLLVRGPKPFPWPSRWLRWPDLGLPSSRSDACDAFTEAWERSGDQRVEIACGGGRGRTGTALACLAIIDGVHPTKAVAYVRQHYDRRAVETPWQRRYVAHYRAHPLGAATPATRPSERHH